MTRNPVCQRPCRYIDIDMVKDVDSPKSRPQDITAPVLAGVEAGDSEVVPDDTSCHVKAGFADLMFLKTEGS